MDLFICVALCISLRGVGLQPTNLRFHSQTRTQKSRLWYSKGRIAAKAKSILYVLRVHARNQSFVVKHQNVESCVCPKYAVCHVCLFYFRLGFFAVSRSKVAGEARGEILFRLYGFTRFSSARFFQLLCVRSPKVPPLAKGRRDKSIQSCLDLSGACSMNS